MPRYIEIGPVVSDKMIFKVFYMDIIYRENKPHSHSDHVFDKS